MSACELVLPPRPLWDMHGPEAAYVQIWHCVNVCICVYLPICLKPNSNLFRLCWGNIWAIRGSQYDIEECVHDKGRNMFRSAKRVLLGLFGGGTDQLLAWLLLWTQWEKVRNCPCSLRIGKEVYKCIHTCTYIIHTFMVLSNSMHTPIVSVCKFTQCPVVFKP